MQNTFTKLAKEIANAFVPLFEALGSVDAFAGFMLDLGWDIFEIPEPIDDLRTPLGILITILDAEGIDIDNVDNLINALSDLYRAIDELTSKPSALFPPILTDDNFRTEFPPQLVDYLLIDYVTEHHSGLANILSLAGLIRTDYIEPQGHRPGYHHRQVIWAELGLILNDPKRVLENAYGWGTSTLQYQIIYEHLVDFGDNLGLHVRIEELDQKSLSVLSADAIAPANVIPWSINMPLLDSDGSQLLDAGLRLFILPETASLMPGFSILPYSTGGLNTETPITEDLTLKMDAGFDITLGLGILLRPGKTVELLTDIIPAADAGIAPPSAAYFKFSIGNNTQNTAPLILLGSDQGSRLLVGKLSLTAGVDTDTHEHRDFYIELNLLQGELIILAGEGDAFLRKILPEDGMNAAFDLGLGLSTTRGVYFRGSGGLVINLPVHKAVGPVDLESVTLEIKVSGDSIPVNLGLSAKTKLGPFLVAVDNVGLTADFAFPGSKGNLGPIDLEMSFKPPTGIGLVIDGGGFKGGGFLEIDPGKNRYVGFLELEFKETVAIKALGLLTTQLPDGSDGFSLLIIITAEFSPIQLGLGFTLNGVGGMLGLNRTANVERLRTGVRDNTLNSILFPTDIVANANRIISDLRQVFPPEPDRFIFGPMAKIVWGTPTLLTIDLGLMIEVPDPVRIVILGVLRALLPDEDERLLQLQVNFLGVIDFEAQMLSFDASIYDSKLLAMTLSGDMAVRLSWGADSNFILTVGGFHPEYEPPPVALPDLRRLTLQLLEGKNPRLTLETYFAITSNTVQFGSRLELYAAASKFNVYGFLSFDVLLQFNPFYFIASIGAMLALRIGSSTIASINLSLTLDGPTPWHAKGTARFKVCWFFTLKVRFDKTFGETRDTQLDDIAVLPRLQAALADSRNWEAQTPRGRTMLVSLKEISVENNQVVAHPFGVIRIAQKEVPLDIGIQKIGSQRPNDGSRYSIQNVQIERSDQAMPQDPEPLDSTPIQEQFAPAQFFERSDSEKLSSKSFEKYDAGIQLSETEKMDASYAIPRAVSYEIYYKDKQRNQRLNRQPSQVKPDLPSFNTWAVLGAVSNSPLSHANNGKPASAPEEVAVIQEPFVVVHANTLAHAGPDAEAGSQAGAYFQMREMIRNDPALEGRLQVVPAFEVNHT